MVTFDMANIETIRARWVGREPGLLTVVDHAKADVRTLLRELDGVADQRDRSRAVMVYLASRMANHAYCDEHPEAAPERDCPFCTDRDSYRAYLALGDGQDFQQTPSAGSVALTGLARRTRTDPDDAFEED